MPPLPIDEVATKESVLGRALALYAKYTKKKVLGTGQMDALLLAIQVISYMQKIPYLNLVGGMDEEISDSRPRL